MRVGGKRPISDSDLYNVAEYLSRPVVQAEIELEMPERFRVSFEDHYTSVTRGESPNDGYLVMPDDAPKFGRQGRIYFDDIMPVPTVVLDLVTDQGKWKNKTRINHTNLVLQLFECGFLLGDNSRGRSRIRTFMLNRFPNMQPIP